MKLVQTKRISGQEVNMIKKVTNKALIELFSDISMYHTFLAGHTSVEGVSPVSWMVMAWKMQVIKRVSMFSTVTVQTWVQSYNRVKARRNYRITDENGSTVALAAAQWAALDAGKGTFIRLTPEVIQAYTAEDEEEVFKSFEFKEYRSFDQAVLKSRKFTPPLSMNDYNGHLHNSEYVNLADEILPDHMLTDMPDNVEMYYRQQILPGKDVILEYCEHEGRHYAAVKSPENGGLHALVILS